MQVRFLGEGIAERLSPYPTDGVGSIPITRSTASFWGFSRNSLESLQAAATQSFPVRDVLPWSTVIRLQSGLSSPFEVCVTVGLTESPGFSGGSNTCLGCVKRQEIDVGVRGSVTKAKARRVKAL